MYKLLLILKYLRKRRIAWVSLVAVMLCTTMVLVVISVMGGWLRMFRQSFHGLSGDVLVDGQSMVGFPHYEEMIRRILTLPEVKAAAPVVRTYGLVNIDNQLRKGVEAVGYPPNIADVNEFMSSLYRKHDEKQLNFNLWPDIPYIPPNRIKADVTKWPGIIVGSGVIGLRKDKNGEIHRDPYIYRAYVEMTVLPISPRTTVIDPTTSTPAREFFWIIDDSRTKVYVYDANRVYIPFTTLQQMLEMDGSDGSPARANEIEIALKPGTDLYAAKAKIRRMVDDVALARNIDTLRYPYDVQTWEEKHATFIGAIEKEKGLITILFGIISIVSIFLIGCIFYMIAQEKTRDIGIIKSVGAAPGGVAGIFLGYGMAIGIVGALLGLLAGWLIVHNINELHAMLGKIGIVVWNPEIYLFDTIPNTMNPPEVIVILIVAVISAIVGAVVPAIVAAIKNPVESLRWE